MLPARRTADECREPAVRPDSRRMRVKEIPNRSDGCLNEVDRFRFWSTSRLERPSFAGEAPQEYKSF